MLIPLHFNMIILLLFCFGRYYIKRHERSIIYNTLALQVEGAFKLLCANVQQGRSPLAAPV